MGTKVLEDPAIAAQTKVKHEDVFQVIIFNDDHNEAGFVVQCLIKVFGHGHRLATEIMLEAHTTGRAVAEVEGESSARLHRDQLRSYGIGADVESI